MQKTSPYKIAFFGNPSSTTVVLDILKAHDYTPELVVSAPDKPVGRKQVLTPPPSKVWAESQNIPVHQPSTFSAIDDSIAYLQQSEWDVFVVFAYGLILPQAVLDIPKYGVLNIHPSLLPELRGPSPVQTAILRDMQMTGVTVMQMDAKMDHGPIITQEMYTAPDEEWPLPAPELENRLVSRGAELLAETIAPWIAGTIEPQTQDHNYATFTRKLEKNDGQLTIDPAQLPVGADAKQALLVVQALAGWPEAYFVHKEQRVKIKSAVIENDTFVPTRVVPEGKSEMSFSAYLSSLTS